MVGLNGTVFAYGATGSGKTHTMVGTPSDPGLMVLSLEDIFRTVAADRSGAYDYDIQCTYIEARPAAGDLPFFLFPCVCLAAPLHTFTRDAKRGRKRRQQRV